MDKESSDRAGKTAFNCCISVLKWIPVLLVVAIIGWSYYAYVLELCIRNMQNWMQMLGFLLFYHILLLLLLWSYCQIIITRGCRVPDNWRLPQVELDRLSCTRNQIVQRCILYKFALDLPITNCCTNGAVRYCKICKIIKPDRSHHCSACNSCVLKMDHHCPWVNNCVNFYNYKYFILFVGYAVLYCLWLALTTLGDFLQFWQVAVMSQHGGDGMGLLHKLFLLIIAITFGISLICLWCYHMYLTLVNRTTLEAFEAPNFRNGGHNKNGYNLGGRYVNFCEVFGNDWKFWLLPIFTSKGDGLSYPTPTATVPQAVGMTNATTNMLNLQSKDFLLDIFNSNTQPSKIAQEELAIKNAAPVPAAAVTTNEVVIEMIGDHSAAVASSAVQDVCSDAAV